MLFIFWGCETPERHPPACVDTNKAYVKITSIPAVASFGNVNITVEYNICGEYESSTMWITIEGPPPNYTFERNYEDISCINLPAWNGTYTFTHQFVYEGTYEVWANIGDASKRDQNYGLGTIHSPSPTSKIQITGTQKLTTLRIWSGKNYTLHTTATPDPYFQAINHNEILLPDVYKYFYGYGLLIQALDQLSNPMNGVTINFSRDDGVYIQSQMITKTLYSGQTYEIKGVAPVQINPYPGTYTKFTNITASASGGFITTSIPILYHDDKEISGGGSSYNHKKDEGGNEILGDNFRDYDESASANTTKDVKVEVDYRDDFEGKLDDIFAEVHNIWIAYGVNIACIKGNSIPSDSTTNVSQEDVKTLLKTNRDPSCLDHIHVILGNSFDGMPTLLGKNIVYGNGGDNYNFWDCANMASGENLWRSKTNDVRYYLDRVGIFITKMSTVGVEQGWDLTKMYAWTIAHELGHALGIYNHNEDIEKNLMNDCKFTFPYANWIEVYQVSLSKLNTRNRLGVETVDIENSH